MPFSHKAASRALLRGNARFMPIVLWRETCVRCISAPGAQRSLAALASGMIDPFEVHHWAESGHASEFQSRITRYLAHNQLYSPVHLFGDVRPYTVEWLTATAVMQPGWFRLDGLSNLGPLGQS